LPEDATVATQGGVGTQFSNFFASDRG